MPKHGGYSEGGAPETKGLRAFRKAVRYGREDAERQVDTATRLGIPQQLISSILKRKQRPGPHIRDAIQREYGVLAADWMTPEERAIATGRRQSA
jgi:hypothetical protein